jgi:competence protein ComEC
VTDQIASPEVAEAPSPKRSAQPKSRPLLPQLRQQSAGRDRLAKLRSSVEDCLDQRRLIVLIPFALIIGLIAFAALPVDPSPWAMASLAVILVVAVAFTGRALHLQRIAVLASAFWLGACLLMIHGQLWGTKMLAYPAYGTFEATVDEVFSAGENGRRAIISHLTGIETRRPVEIRRARIVVPAEPPLAAGDRIRANLRLAPVPGPILPESFDGQFHAYFAGIGAYGNVTSGLALIASDQGVNPVRAIDGLRYAIADRVDVVLDGPAADIGRAMTVGDQSQLTDETRELMASAGLAHVYSISGLHLSIVAGGIFAIVRLALAALGSGLGMLPIKKLAALAGVVAACGYLLLAGGTANVPAFRSTLMLVLIFGAVLVGRRALTMRNVALAALVIILLDPANVFRASFQLSFAAVVALIGVYELPRKPREGSPGLIGRGLRTVWIAAWTSFIAGSATLLFSAFHFQQTAPLGVLGNVIALPVLSIVIMPFAVFSVLLMPFGVEAPFLAVMGWGIEQMLLVATLVSGWSAGLEANPLLTPSALIVGLVALAWFAFLYDKWRFLGPALAVPVILLFGFDTRPDVLIADTTQSVAIREGAGMGLLDGRTGSFAVDVWSEHYAIEIAPSLERARCDSLGCIYAGDGYTIALVERQDAFAEDCQRNTLVITRLYTPSFCKTTQVIDAGDLATGGVHWLRWNSEAGRFDVRPAITQDRVWRPQR